MGEVGRGKQYKHSDKHWIVKEKVTDANFRRFIFISCSHGCIIISCMIRSFLISSSHGCYHHVNLVSIISTDIYHHFISDTDGCITISFQLQTAVSPFHYSISSRPFWNK